MVRNVLIFAHLLLVLGAMCVKFANFLINSMFLVKVAVVLPARLKKTFFFKFFDVNREMLPDGGGIVLGRGIDDGRTRTFFPFFFADQVAVEILLLE